MKKTNQAKKEKFNSEEKISEENKLLCNKLFTREAVKNIGNALILDAEKLVTTKYLTRRNFKDINVPNPFVYDIIKKDTRIKAHNMLLSEFISTTKKKFTTVWLDYCGSFGGNKTTKINPQEDIKRMFDRKLLKNDSVFAVTFSYRTRNAPQYTGQDEDNARHLITDTARLNGYNAVCMRTHKYTGMFFIIYRIYT